MPAKLLTLVIPFSSSGTQILLGKKLRGFGAGYINGFGGKVESFDSSIVESAKRELKEEAGITATTIQHVGKLTFNWVDEVDETDHTKMKQWLVHVFRVDVFEGTPAPSDEMEPIWYPAQLQHIPFDSMWADDVHWYPLFLKRVTFVGDFDFKNTTELIRHTTEEVDGLDPPEM
jgi:8-oxo-dGTP pyrophosphatase MutT (NUDIX family)